MPSLRVRIVAFFSLVVPLILSAQIAERNVNMVAGTEWPDGDPFLQRQNEPSVAVSTRNSQHLLAASNDYRTVDLPGLPAGRMPADAWSGIFRSYDGGRSWKSSLLPGYPQDSSAAGTASPLKGYQAAADPVMRAGTNGMFYFSGIVFNREENGASALFVSRFIDRNHKEAGEPIAYINTNVLATGTSGRSIDKPWIAVDLPRAGASACNIDGQTFPGGNVYIAWTEILNDTNQIHTKLLFARSVDCGQSWSAPIKISEGNFINQGVSVAVDPSSGTVGLSWRRFVSTTETNAMLYSESKDGGLNFTKATEVSTIQPFEQGTSTVSARSSAYPVLAFDAEGRRYIAWSQRAGPEGDGRIVISTSSDGRKWKTPAQAEPSPLRGHQFMPALLFTHGSLHLLYYDLREDSTIGVFTPSPTIPSQFTESRKLVGDLAAPATPEKVFTTFLMDAPPEGYAPLKRRHTIDVRLGVAEPGTAPTFTSTRVSQYMIGSRPGASEIEQLQVNPPNLPMFRQGTVPFIGDYIDLTAQTFWHDGTRWRANIDRNGPAELHAMWTDNRDVRPPADGNWKNYTPVRSASNAGTSKFDPTQPVPPCVVGQTGSRNQNIYTARITSGLAVTIPGNAKPLSTTVRRAFVVTAHNTTLQTRSFRLSIAAQPAGGKASFVEFPLDAAPVTAVDVRIPPKSTATRSVLVTSTNPKASVRVDVAELTSPGDAAPVPGGLQSSGTINPDITNPDIANPDIANPDIANPDIANIEVRNPDIANPDIANPDIANPDIANPDIANPDIANPDIANPDIANPDIANPDIANPDIANPDIANPDIANPDIANGALTDTTWRVRNQGNTTASYAVKLLKNQDLPSGFRLQLILSRTTATPIARGCELGLQRHTEIVTSIVDPEFTDEARVSNVDTLNVSEKNATIWIAPGDVANVTLRTYDPNRGDLVTFDAATAVAPVIVSHASNTGTTVPAASLIVLTTQLPNGAVLQPYAASLQAFGGVGQHHWTATGLPPGLVLSDSGQVSGTPAVAGTFQVALTVVDSGQPQHRSTRSLSLQVFDELKVTTATLPQARLEQPYEAQLTASGGSGPYGWSISSGTLPTGLTLTSGGRITGTPTRSGSYNFEVTVVNAGPPAQSASRSYSLEVVPFVTFATQPAGETFACMGTPNDLPLVCDQYQVQPRPVVLVRSASGAPLAGVEVALRLGTNPGGGRLLGSTTAVTNEVGEARFGAMCIDEPGSGYTIVAEAAGASVTSGSFVVGAKNSLGITCTILP